MQYYLAALLVIATANWIAQRHGTSTAKRLTLALSVGAPVLLGAAFNAWLIYRNGASATFGDPYFPVLWMIVVGATVATTTTALLSRGLASRM